MQRSVKPLEVVVVVAANITLRVASTAMALSDRAIVMPPSKVVAFNSRLPYAYGDAAVDTPTAAMPYAPVLVATVANVRTVAAAQALERHNGVAPLQ